MAARRIDVELVDLATQEDDVGSVIKVGSSVSVERRESGLVCCFSGRALGAVPAQHHASLAEADFSGTIRSVRRGGPEPKTLTSILVRFTPATGSTEGAGVKQGERACYLVVLGRRKIDCTTMASERSLSHADASRVPPEQRLIQELQADEFRHLSSAQLESLGD